MINGTMQTVGTAEEGGPWVSLGLLFAELHMSDRRKRSISYPAGKKKNFRRRGAEF